MGLLPILGIASSLIGASSANKAADAQKSAAKKQIKLTRAIHNETTENLSPFLNAGTNALNQYVGEVGSSFETSPGYLFRMQQGQDAIQASAAARGGLFSGATGAALNTHAQGVASDEFNTYMNRLQGLGQMGQSAAAMQGAAGQNYATQSGNALANYGNAAAAGYVGAGNALNQGINNVAGAWQYMNNQNNGQNDWFGGGFGAI